MKVIKRILICILLLFAYYLLFNPDKIYAGFVVGQTGINIHFSDLDQNGQNGPYHCTQQGEKGQCNSGHHYYEVTKKWLISSTGVTGGPTGEDRTNKNNLKWTRWNKDENYYKIGPYKMHFENGEITKVIIKTDQGDVELANESSTPNGKYRVQKIKDKDEFYIFVHKSTKVRKIKKIKVEVTGTAIESGYFKYEFTCRSVSGNHGGHACSTPDGTQVLERSEYDTQSIERSIKIELPGVLGLVQLHIYKYDRNVPTLPVAGAKYEMWSDDGVCRYSGTTDANGYLNFPDVLIGTYVVKEVYVPVGYAISGYATINGITFVDLTNMPVYLGGDCTFYVYNDSYISLKGKVFLDNTTGKDNGPPNGYYDSGDSLVPNIEVKLYRADNNQEVGTRYTDANGHYEFDQVASAYSYYLRFSYNGQAFEATTYNESSAGIELRSYATEGIATRQLHNSYFSPVNASNPKPKWTDSYTSAAFNIFAYTGPDRSKWY